MLIIPTRSAMPSRRAYHAVAVDKRTRTSLRPPRTINVAVISKAEVEKAAREAMQEQAWAAARVQVKPHITVEWKDKTRQVPPTAILLTSSLILGLTWLYMATAAKECEMAVAAALADTDKAIAQTQNVIARARSTWNEKVAPLEGRVRALEGETISQTTKIEGLTSALRATLIATNLWRWRSNTPILPSQPLSSEIVAPGGAIVRSAADPASVQLTSLPTGTKVTIDQQIGRRVHISSPTEGWLSTHTTTGQSIIRGFP